MEEQLLLNKQAWEANTKKGNIFSLQLYLDW